MLKHRDPLTPKSIPPEISVSPNGDQFFRMVGEDGADAVAKGRVLIGGARDKWRDDFKTIDLDKWGVSAVHEDDAFVIAGNVQGSSFGALSKSALDANTVSTLAGKRTFSAPYRFGYGASLSQRIHGELALVRIAAVDDMGAPIPRDGEDLAVVGSPMLIEKIVVASNVATIYFGGDHALRYDHVFVISGAIDTRLNVVTRVTRTENRRCVTAALTLANGTYQPGASCVAQRIDFSRGAADVMGLALFDATTANAVFFNRGAGSPELLSNPTSFGTSYSDALYPSAQPYAINAQPRFNTEMVGAMDVVKWGATAVDSATAATYNKRTQNVPDPSKSYAVFFDLVALPNKAVPIEILSAVKTGATTATVTTKGPHGLATGAYARAYGAVDQTVWPNVTTEVALTVTGPDTLTMVWGTAATSTIYGGFLMPVNGAASVTGAANVAVRGTTWYNGRLYVATNSAPSVNIGDTVRLVGCRESGGSERAGLTGRFRALAITPNVLDTAISAGATTTSASPTITVANTGAMVVGGLLVGTGVGASAAINAIAPNVSVTASVASTASGTINALTITGLVLEPIGFAAPVDAQPAAALSAGGLIRETDFRINYVRCLDHTRTPVEVIGGHSTGDVALATPVNVLALPTVSANTTESALIAPTLGALTAAATTNATSLKTAAGTVYAVSITNTSAAPIHLKLYNKASAPTVGTDVPVVTISVPANTEITREFGRVGRRFSTGIAYALTANQPTADATAVTAGSLVAIDYI